MAPKSIREEKLELQVLNLQTQVKSLEQKCRAAEDRMISVLSTYTEEFGIANALTHSNEFIRKWAIMQEIKRKHDDNEALDNKQL